MATILVVDDDADHRRLFAWALIRAGHEPLAVSAAEEAITTIHDGGIDAVLLDVRLPGRSGIDLCRRLRKDPTTVNLPIVIVSTQAYDTHIRAGLAAGADDYVVKPFHRGDLVNRLDAAIAKSPVHSARAANLALRAATASLTPRSEEPQLARESA
ncbi:response regulator transcription factor [Pilimelia columellifera]|uniref:Response regulatory domain-containing protein n=1 Tax=Pilimelia columellifera subsp. columellifera TaxID=706583 RepID=A0ABP6AYW8_9ACTN